MAIKGRIVTKISSEIRKKNPENISENGYAYNRGNSILASVGTHTTGVARCRNSVFLQYYHEYSRYESLPFPDLELKGGLS